MELVLERRRLRPRRGAIALAVALLVVLGAVGGGAVVHRGTIDAQAAARSERDAALRSLDAALAAARGGGVDPAHLANVVSLRAAALAEAVPGTRLLILDGGATGELRHQASELRNLQLRVGDLVAADTDAARSAAGPALDKFGSVILQASSQGVEVSAAQTTLEGAREALDGAATPAAVAATVASVQQGVDALDQAIAVHAQQLAEAKAAAERAAAAQAALNDARGGAQSALARADSVLAQARALPQLQLGTAPAIITAQHAAFAAATTVDEFDAVASTTAGASSGLSALLAARSGAYGEMAQARSVVSTAINVKLDPGTDSAQLDALQPQLDAAGTVPVFNSLRAQIGAIVAPLQDQLNILAIGPGKVIVIDKTKQDLTAYDNGAVVVHTLVTTGRAVLPTPSGHFSVRSKSHPWLMVSEYPYGSIGWYPPTWVQYVVWFRDDGYGIHDASWQPDSTLGPGSQNGPYSSHGCVHVPYAIARQLYTWADIGDAVIVK